MKSLLHFAEDGDTSGYFPQLARWHDRTRYRMYFGTLKPIAPWLREYMEGRSVECVSCDCTRQVAYPRGLLTLTRFLRARRIDILHTHLYHPTVVGLWAGVLARTPIRVVTRHYSDYHTRENRTWHVRMDRMCTRLSHAVIGVSAHTSEHLIEVEHAPKAKIHTVLNGIDFDRVRLSGPDARERIRHEFGAQDSHLLLIVARLHPEKGHEFLFKAMPAIQRRVGRPVRLLVAGRGPFEQAYREQVRSVGCGESVTFVGFRRDVADLMAAADLMVLPSVAEAFGLVLTEALYLGTPVVATRVGGIPEIVSDGMDGVLVPPADTDALTEAIVKLLNDPEARHRLAGAASERVRRRFGFQDMVRSYESVYEGLANGRGRKHA